MLSPNVLLLKSSSEIFLKSERVKQYFNRKLRDNIKTALHNAGLRGFSLKQGRGRMFLYVHELEEAAGILRKVFGLHSIAPAFEFNTESLSSIVENVVSFAEGRFEKVRTFAVRVSRSGEQPFSSQELERALGAEILRHFPFLRVNLNNPERILFLELRGEKGYCYVEEIPCFSGLPLGVEGFVGVFFEGKEEELVAAWLLMKRGCNIFPIVKRSSKKMEKHLSVLVPWNLGRNFALSLEKDLMQLIEERGLLALVRADSIVSKKAFLEYAEFDERMPLPVFRPLLFHSNEWIKKAANTIK